MINAAKKYIDTGFYCLPVKLDKSPAIGKWRNGEVKVEDFENAVGIGIMCGEESGGLECFDFDNKFANATDILTAFLEIVEVAEIYDRYKLPVNATQSEGYHLLFRCDINDGNKKLASRNDINGRPVAMIETRGKGGYFVAPPTDGYTEVTHDVLNVAKITVEEREVLFAAARSFNEVAEMAVPIKVDSGEKISDEYHADPVSVEEMEAALSNAGWTKLTEFHWRRPEKDKGISATLGKCGAGIFYPFTSTCHPFQQEKCYTAFQVVTLLEYNGDFKKFAGILKERYKKEVDHSKQNKPTGKISDYKSMMADSFINPNLPPVKPPVVMEILNNKGEQLRLFTLGNFSAITGRAKSKKSFLSSIMLAAAGKNQMVQNKLVGNLPENKNLVIKFDTEQSRYDAFVASRNALDLAGVELPNFLTFDLRRYDPMERCGLINYILEKYKNSLGFVVIDGVADLAKAINDEEEAIRVANLLMKWTDIYNIHIVTVIHQNKGNNFATGHLGSSVMKKAEAVISVEKDEQEYSKSTVHCDMIRGTQDFDDFIFEIDSNGLPNIVNPFTPF